MHSLSLVVLVVVALADGGSAPEPRTQAPVAAQGAKAPAPVPEPRWKELPGWLGFATVKPGAKPQHYWTPEHPKAQVVLFTDLWKSVPVGTKVRLLTPSGPREGTYLGTSDERYGCEENTATLAGFATEKPLPEGPVWVLPPGGGSEALTALPVKEVPASSLGTALPKGKKAAGKGVQAFEAGGMSFLLTKTGKLRGQLTVLHEGRKVGTSPITKGDMGGSDTSPLSLQDADEVGVPRPLVAYQLGKEGPVVVVLGIRGYEGHQFMLAVRRGDKAGLLQQDTEALYFCAF